LPFPPVLHRLGRPGLLLAALFGMAAAAQAQVPSPSRSPLPNIAEDEKDFLGLTSLALGSGARAFGMGGAFLARADDATAASWNPAGLSYLRRPEFTVVGARNSFVREPTGVGSRLLSDRFAGNTLDFAAATYPIEIGPASGSVQLSFQRVFSFRGDRTIDRTDQLLTSEGSGGFDVVALGTGFRILRAVRIGGTVNRWVNGYHQDRARLAGRRGRGDTKQAFDFRLSGWNFNAGLIWSPIESLSFGAVFKTTMKGTAEVDRVRQDEIPQPRPDPSATPPPPITTTNEQHSTVLQANCTDCTDEDRTAAATPHRNRVALSIPGAVGVGISWRPWSVLTASLDFTRTFWSKGRIHNFFTLARTEPDQANPFADVFPELLYPTLDDEKQSDTEQLRVGAEYVVLARRLKLPLRVGFFTDKQFFLDDQGRPPKFHGFTAGIGIAAGPLLIDFAYLRETGNYLDPEADPDDPEARGAERSTRINRVFVSIIYRHGGGP
jgi:long-chain fatty acid transport protein